MPAVSKAQQRFFGMVRAAQKGEMASPSSEVSQAASSMSKSDVKKFAKTKHKGLPEKVKSEAYYGGEEQRKKDEKKKKIDAFMDKAMPARTFDQMGRETDRRTGKLKEGKLDPKVKKSMDEFFRKVFKANIPQELSEKKNGRCPAGQYYCYTDEKCKPIPKGFKVVGPAGMLRKENGHTEDETNKKNGKKNGNVSNGNGNGNGSNGSGSGNGGSSVGESYDANDYNTLKDQIGSAKKHRKTFKQFRSKS